MKNYLLILLLVSGSIFSQNVKELKKSALRDAKAISNASIKEDYETLIKHTHPNIIKEYGDRQLKAAIEDLYRGWKAQKIKIVSSKVDEIADIKKEKREYRCLVKNTVRMNFNGRKVTLKSSLFGFYDKKKELWYFVESDKLLNDDETQKIFKNFKTEIQIPEDEHIPEN
ncbi:NTF2-like N-terminal transpeptidase domain-containing protein [Aquimarina sp. MMG016]|uniref:NTF2-like N-terminal transpeptidase domain-containing protein n=1 Tax=Aquimarina sp. MMG016 TaxID=2822690 RepID=UPI001B39E3E8|nr:NTF2-like N-terminal transpeptidase domain-containing protein [Aquimarina sp. MMG016]MBQ4820040.1 hypothetical protein [Aquimarina sp. MMG016]